jgi:hypothetical protein
MQHDVTLVFEARIENRDPLFASVTRLRLNNIEIAVGIKR